MEAIIGTNNDKRSEITVKAIPVACIADLSDKSITGNKMPKAM